MIGGKWNTFELVSGGLDDYVEEFPFIDLKGTFSFEKLSHAKEDVNVFMLTDGDVLTGSPAEYMALHSAVSGKSELLMKSDGPPCMDDIIEELSRPTYSKSGQCSVVHSESYSISDTLLTLIHFKGSWNTEVFSPPYQFHEKMDFWALAPENETLLPMFVSVEDLFVAYTTFGEQKKQSTEETLSELSEGIEKRERFERGL